MAAEEGSATRVKFDARKLYYEELVKRLNHAGEAAAAGDLQSWRICLFNMFNCVVPWISADDKERIEGRLRKVRISILGLYDIGNDQAGTIFKRRKATELELELLELEQEIIMAGKHLFLPEKEADDEEINMESLLKGSM